MPDDAPVTSGPPDQLSIVEKRREAAEKLEKREYNRFIRWGWGAIAAAALGYLALTLRSHLGPTILLRQGVGALLLFGASGATAVWWVKRSRVSRLKDEQRSLELEADLLRFDVSPAEHRAEKLLSVNQYELRRYYGQVLSHASWTFVLGIICLLSGVGIVIATLYLLRHPPPLPGQTSDALPLALVGSVGALLTNFVAVIYLRMHASAAQNIGSFHRRLVRAHSLFFANVLVSRLRPEDQNAALRALAMALAAQSDQPSEEDHAATRSTDA